MSIEQWQSSRLACEGHAGSRQLTEMRSALGPQRTRLIARELHGIAQLRLAELHSLYGRCGKTFPAGCAASRKEDELL